MEYVFCWSIASLLYKYYHSGNWTPYIATSVTSSFFLKIPSSIQTYLRTSKMPPKLKPTKKWCTTPTRGNRSLSEEIHSLCCEAIIDEKDEALLCEGEQSCNRWMHRYCAGVSVEYYKSLDQSQLSFNCSLCVQRKQAALIDELKSTIAALTAEFSELCTAIAEKQ